MSSIGSTPYDGATRDLLVTSISLNGKTGVKAPLANAYVEKRNIDYTIMMWVKPMVTDFTNNHYIMQLMGEFECYFSLADTLVCDFTYQPSLPSMNIPTASLKT